MVADQGRYSLLRGEWLQEPSPEPAIDDTTVQRKADSLRRTIDSAIDHDDAERLKALLERLHRFRDAGLAEGGEFSLENLVYKSLRRDGTIDRLKQAALREYDQSLSYSRCACEDD